VGCRKSGKRKPTTACPPSSQKKEEKKRICWSLQRAVCSRDREKQGKKNQSIFLSVAEAEQRRGGERDRTARPMVAGHCREMEKEKEAKKERPASSPARKEKKEEKKKREESNPVLAPHM